MIDLGDGKHISVNAHSGRVWLSSYNGVGTVNPLDPATAKKLSKALWRAAVQLEESDVPHDPSAVVR